MELKLKENLKVDSFTFRKKVMETMMEIKGDNRNYTVNDIRFYTMISFLNAINEDEKILVELAKAGNVIELMEKDLEPMFEEYVLNDEEKYTAFEEIVEDLTKYYDREVKRHNHITSLIYDTLDELGDLDQGDIVEIVQNLVKSIEKVANTNILNKKTSSKTTKKITEEEVKADIQDLKLQQLINKYKNVNNEENTTEE